MLNSLVDVGLIWNISEDASCLIRRLQEEKSCTPRDFRYGSYIENGIQELPDDDVTTYATA
jgi:hypothetical protein